MRKRITQFLNSRLRLLLMTGIVSAAAFMKPAAGQIVTIGYGTFTSAVANPVVIGGTAFFGTPPKTTHLQVHYTAEEINAAGITAPGMIDSIAWEVSTVPSQAIKNYTIKGKLHYPDSINTFVSNNLTTLAMHPTHQPVLGWSWVRFQTPFYWNGTDNIVFDICSDTISTPSSGRVKANVPSGVPNCFVSASSTTPLCGVYTGGFPNTVKPNIRMSFRAVPACTGVPASVSVIPAGPIQGCAGSIRLLQLESIPSGPFTVRWERSINSAPWTAISPGGSGIGFYAQIVSGITQKYRAVISCAATGQSITSNEVTMTAVNDPVYTSLPYTQDFENTWIDRCGIHDVPDVHWTNMLPTGPFSWRRDDDGATANWEDPVVTWFYPPFTSGSHCARVQTSKGPGEGSLMLHMDCSGPGDKEARFDFKCNTSGNDAMEVSVSADGGATFVALTTVGAGGVNAQWMPQVVQIPSTSATTVLRFKAMGFYNQYGDFDMGIDNVRIYPGCSGTPEAGSVDSTTACLGEGVSLRLNGSSQASALSWRWQETTNGISWTDVAGGDVENPTTPLNGPTWFRCIVTCTNSGLSDTTAPRLINVSPAYGCYCSSGSTVASPMLNLGNVKILTEPAGTLLLDNGNPLPATANLEAKKHYTDYTDVTPADLYRDSTYKLNLTFFTSNGTNVNPMMGRAYIKAWIDYDQNGVFDNNEQIMGHQKESDIYTDSAVFTVPVTAQAGLAGMRIVTNNTWDSTLVTPCGSYSYGETEDYLVRLWNVPCASTPTAGTAAADDSLSCPGYPVVLTNSGYDSTSGELTHIWQSSADGSTWTDIAGSENQPLYTATFPGVTTWFRMKADCGISSTAAFSNAVKVNKSVACYCVSYADGGFAGMADSSDVGAFSFATLNFPLSGGHLNNAGAVHHYTHHAYLEPVMLYVDSTYNFTLDHTILRNDHADAKVTMFIDYNGNGTYDIPAERVYSVITSMSSWQKNGSITIPSDAVLDKPVGMRVIINNDTTANVPSDEACGLYISGETEDFTLKFRAATVGIDPVSTSISGLHIFPNPTTGMAAVKYEGKAVDAAVLMVQTATGQVVEERNLRHLKPGDTYKLDLRRYSKGIYFITLKAEDGTQTRKIVVQ